MMQTHNDIIPGTTYHFRRNGVDLYRTVTDVTAKKVTFRRKEAEGLAEARTYVFIKFYRDFGVKEEAI